MKKLQTEIYEHDTDVDITHKINSIELESWVSHLEYIGKELESLIGLCGDGFNDCLEDDNVLNKFQKKEVENDALLRLLHNYFNARSEIIECEDMHCDMAFMRKHEAFRRNYLYHLEKYRRLKGDFFSSIRGKLTLSNRSS